MIPDPDSPEVWRIAGAGLGALISVVFWWPGSRLELLRRAAVSIGCGWAFGPSVVEYLEWSPTPDHALAGSAFVGIFSWVGIGLIERLMLARTRTPKK